MRAPRVPYGKWSLLAVVSFVCSFSVFVLLVAAGQRGGDEFFDNLWLAVPFLGAYLAGVAAFVLGAVAMTIPDERSIAVAAATGFGLLVTAFGVLEVVVPH